MSRKWRSSCAVASSLVLVAAMFMTAATFIGQASAQIAPPISLDAEPTSNSALAFLVSEPTESCESETALTVTGNGLEAIPTSLTILDPNTVEVVLPSSTQTPLEFTLTCLDAEDQPVTARTGREFFAIHLTKTVEGRAPADAIFVVNVTCEASTTPEITANASFRPSVMSPVDPLMIDVSFDPAGGTQDVFGYFASDCVITELDAFGAATSVITPGTVNTDTPGVYPVEVVNTFVARPAFTG